MIVLSAAFGARGVQRLLHASRHEGEAGALQTGFVADEAQGRGIGRLLVAHMQSEARAAGLDRVKVVSHLPAEGRGAEPEQRARRRFDRDAHAETIVDAATVATLDRVIPKECETRIRDGPTVIMQAYRTRQEDQLGALGLVLNAAVLWTTRYLDAAVDHLRALPPEEREHDVLDEDVARVSPLKHANLNCLGRYSFAARPPREGLRPLRDPATVHLDEDDEGTGE
ncbi:hypothetical protein TNCT6_72030 [Streptomyces sp. 6-11-2]|nr:hypothetical protein TNCT6_72030 [Streptomyces sp. 6-11-2]